MTLKSAPAKRGHDEIYHARREDGTPVGVVRVNSPFKEQVKRARDGAAAILLEPRKRLEREWWAYTRLSPSQLAPRPIWQGADAIACAWLDWERASAVLIRDRERFWEVLERVMPAVARMHDCGVTHLDLNLGNVLLDPAGHGVALIDFEFGPAPWLDMPRQKGWDFLRLINDFSRTRRGGRHMANDIDRLIHQLVACVDGPTRDADLHFARGKLNRLAAAPGLHAALRRVFHGL